jgi:GTPase SAR1 family protein
MRRKRSCAFHAETQEEYLKIAKENQFEENFYYNLPAGKQSGLRSQNNKFDISRESEDGFEYERSREMEGSFEYDDPIRQSEELDLDDFDSQRPVLKNSPSACMLDLYEDSAAVEEMFETEPAQILREYTYKYMLIGGLHVGKHALINSQFPDSSDLDSTPLMTRLDLLIRKTETPTVKTSFEFWIKELFNDSYERLIELYYKKCSVFVFVYDLTSYESFEKLEKEITKIRDCVGAEKFVGVLIATRSDEIDKRTVKYEEGLDLKAKYGLSHFSETNMFIEKETQQLLKKLEQLSNSESQRF